MKDVVHKGLNNVLVTATDLQSTSDYRVVFNAFLSKVNEEKQQKEAEGKDASPEGIVSAEEKKDVLVTSNDITLENMPSQFLSKEKAFHVVNLLGFGVSEDEFNASYAKWAHNEEHTIDENNFVGFCKQELAGGKARTVVLKFMKDEEKFYNEIVPRFEAELHSSCVMSVLKRFDAASDPQFKEDIVKQGEIDRTRSQGQEEQRYDEQG